MSSDRLLIWIFVAATVIVYIALCLAAEENEAARVLSLGLLFGQTTVLAVWASCGPGHRLLRGAVLVLATAGLAFFVAFLMVATVGEVLTVLALLAVIAWSGSLLFGVVARRIQRKESGTEFKPFRVPLIEFFGWTIVAAFISLALRQMDSSALPDMARDGLLIFIAVMVLVPLAGVWVMRLGLRRPLFPLIAAVAVAAIIALRPNSGPDSVYLGLFATAEAGYIAIAAVLFRLVLWSEKVSTADPEVEPTADEQQPG